ncbi:hypothetical protein [Kibdelosporangium aridum]|uniref:Uncharacterized protein n=1 Tax=Kibdelosporangium aridum TaxID=2030 RepID=A0A1Y5YAS7_KIBAR|nr:hypothetical protein [Kibdelosporangium aridum]SMD26442.1 hypothetical protein SAMN05661093_10025 [Kibdelosporangium aridum]
MEDLRGSAPLKRLLDNVCAVRPFDDIDQDFDLFAILDNAFDPAVFPSGWRDVLDEEIDNL